MANQDSKFSGSTLLRPPREPWASTCPGRAGYAQRRSRDGAYDVTGAEADGRGADISRGCAQAMAEGDGDGGGGDAEDEVPGGGGGGGPKEDKEELEAGFVGICISLILFLFSFRFVFSSLLIFHLHLFICYALSFSSTSLLPILHPGPGSPPLALR